jgi:signal transduction histidine kinase
VFDNVGVSQAAIRVHTTLSQVLVEVIDRGRGYDPAATPAGFGQTCSIRHRIAEIGGYTDIESVPGRGTRVRLWAPRAAAKETVDPSMTRFWAWWLRRSADRDQLVFPVIVMIRLAGVVILGYSLPLVWLRLPYPAWSALLAFGLVIETVAALLWRLRHAELDRIPLALDLPTGVVALLLGEAWGRHLAVIDWASFPYAYTVLVALTLGMSCRTPIGALGCGATWAAAYVAGAMAFAGTDPVRASAGALSLLVNAAAGHVVARLLRQAAVELAVAGDAAVSEVTAAATAGERARHARVLHDRVLQTLEALARTTSVADERLRTLVGEQAAWLRTYIETGQADRGDDLASGLAAATRAVSRRGTAVRLNDAWLRASNAAAAMPAARRDVLIDAARATLDALATAGTDLVICAVPQDGGVLVTVLSTQPIAVPHARLAEATRPLTAAGGRFLVEQGPYVELWLAPTAGQGLPGPT